MLRIWSETEHPSLPFVGKSLYRTLLWRPGVPHDQPMVSSWFCDHDRDSGIRDSETRSPGDPPGRMSLRLLLTGLNPALSHP